MQYESSNSIIFMRTLGSRDDTMVRALAFHQCGPASIWVEFVVGSQVALRVFLWVLQFSSPHKKQHLQTPIRPR